MSRTTYGYVKLVRSICCGLLFFIIFNPPLYAQDVPKKYTVKQGKMYIYLGKSIRETALDSFIAQYGLYDLDLKEFIRTNITDSLKKLGWQVEENTALSFVISKPLGAFENINNPADRIVFADGDPSLAALFPAVSSGVVYGINRFRNGPSFTVKASEVTFLLRNHSKATRVMLAGSFNNWSPETLRMTKTDSGWIARVKLGPGKYWYKFIVDGNWMVDNDNQLRENDGRGNINSVFYRTNVTFRIPGFTNAKRVYVAGSFNDWNPRQLQMTKSSTGWELPLYLAEGTHSYKFVVDGEWRPDEGNPERIPDGHNGYNSVLRIGKPHLFKLAGHTNAQRVMLAGSFNQWRDFELEMKKTATGWELPYVLGSGNYQYKFKVDGKWIADPANPFKSQDKDGNSFLILGANYTFRLKGYNNAKSVFLAGEFNNWNPTAYAMKREGDEWVFPVYLSPGKHRYKFIVNGEWIRDPYNKLWEQNEHGTGNSILWIDPNAPDNSTTHNRYE